MWQMAGLTDTSTLTSLPQLKLLQPIRFPQFSELAGASVNVQPVAKKETGLFEGMLGGDPQVLFQDLVSCPHKYQPGTDILLQQIIAGSKTLDSLDPNERLMLDQAALEFAQPSRAPVETPTPSEPREEDPADYLPELHDETSDERPARGPMDTYWWL